MSMAEVRVCPRASMSVMSLLMTKFPFSSKVTVFDPDKAPKYIHIIHTGLDDMVEIDGIQHTHIHTKIKPFLPKNARPVWSGMMISLLVSDVA